MPGQGTGQFGQLDRSAEQIMEHLMSPPVPRHARRAEKFCPSLPAHHGGPKDLRWILLDLVRTCRGPLGLRDRDITVLRGLLSLVPANAGQNSLVVFASNRVLIERCDGIDERTLRRRIEHLQAKGLLCRRSSPNGKRFQIRDDHAEARLTYGIDLSALFGIKDQLQALAESEQREEQRKSALRSLIRDVLYHHAHRLPHDIHEVARLSLRRTLSGETLQTILDRLSAEVADEMGKGCLPATQMTGSDSQNDRHIQRSYKDSYESEGRDADILSRSDQQDSRPAPENAKNDITVDECIALAPNAVEMAMERPRSWPDVIALSSTLAPAIGLSGSVVDAARTHLGAHGSALAILGLVEAFGRIKNPQAYLSALTVRARTQGLDLVRMFRSLVRCRARVVQWS